MEEIVDLLLNITKNYNKILNLDFENVDLNCTQVFILLQVIKKPGLFQDELKKLCYVEKPAITKALKKLIDEEFVIKKKMGEDKRFSFLYPTEKGISLEPYLKSIEKYHTNIFFENIDEDMISNLKSYLDKINYNLISEFNKR